MTEHAIVLRGVSKRFRRGERFDSLRDAIPALARRALGRVAPPRPDRDFWALRDVDLAVEPGEVLGVIGHNGAGKSTMLKLLSGVMKPTIGTIETHGRLSALIEVGAGFHPDLTGRENIYLNGTILGMTRREISRRFDEIVAFSGLEEFLDTPVKRYSTGMYSRLGFAIAAHVDSDILVVDEVLSVGDYVFQNRCIERMKEVVRSGAAVIFVSHNLGAVTSMCRSAVLLDHGRIIGRGTAQDVVRQYLARVRTPTDKIDKDAYVSRLDVRGATGPQVRFEPGEAAWVDVEVKANRRCERLSLGLYLTDQKNYQAFDTSTERLGQPSFSLEPGQIARFTFHLHLHLARGAFHFGANVYRYDAQRLYDEAFPMATIFVDSEVDVRGVANLYPTVIQDGNAARRMDHQRATSTPSVASL
jgi:lipopolysaccharide transport system ATP-binding protein